MSKRKFYFSKFYFRKFGRLSVLCMALLCAAGICSGCGKEAVATTMHLVKTTGDVTVEDGKAKSVSVIDNLGLFDGYRISTAQASFAWVNLDDVKLTKMDESSDVTVQKDGKNLELVIGSGNLYFNVTEPLSDDETMNIRTSNMIIGIRGTEGWVEVPDENHMKVFLLEGKVECTIVDENSNVLATETIEAGEMADMVYAGTNSTITTENFDEVPVFVTEERNAQVAVQGDGQETDGSDETAADQQPESSLVPWAEAGIADHAMDWQDENLEAAMREVTGIAEGDILLSDVWEIRSLQLMDKEICNINALSELRNLTYLNLCRNQISDITPLANLTNLTWLRLTEKQISDITPLTNLTNLRCLILDGTQVSDITPLTNLTNLETLALWGNPVSDITPLTNLTNLTDLKLVSEEISDITPLANLTNLTQLNLQQNQISDITPLANLTNLTQLWLNSNQISDITPLSNMSSLVELYLEDNPITDYSVVDGLPSLEKQGNRN